METSRPPGPGRAHDKGGAAEDDIRLNDDGLTYTVIKAITFLAASGEVITVPEDYVTDLSSLPDFARCGAVLILLGLFLRRYFDYSFLLGLESLPIPFGFLLVWFSGSLRHQDRYTRAAIIHDWLYATHHGPRSRCDQLFREALADSNTEDWERVTIYWAVRIWGIYAWRSHSRHRVMPKDARDKSA